MMQLCLVLPRLTKFRDISGIFNHFVFSPQKSLKQDDSVADDIFLLKMFALSKHLLPPALTYCLQKCQQLMCLHSLFVISFPLPADAF